MPKLLEFLKEWITSFVKSKDAIARKIQSIEQKQDRVFVKYAHKDQEFFIDPFFEKTEKIISEKSKDDYFTIVCFNTKENIRHMIAKWDRLADHPHLNIFFINPFSSGEKVWVIYPHTHSQIADRSTLERGIASISENVEETSREMVEKKYQ